MRLYAVQVTQGTGTGYIWSGIARNDVHASGLARQAFERARRRSPRGALMTLRSCAVNTA